MICPFFESPIYLFFTSGVPPLLYYSHVPSVIISLFVGFFVFWNGRHLLLNRLLFGITAFFSLWVIIALITWTNINSDIILFVWSLLGLTFSFIAIFSIYFIYVFLEKKDISLQVKVIFLALLTPVFLLSSTYYNLRGFNLTDCDAFKFENMFFQTYYILLGALAIIWIFVLLVRHYRVATGNFRREIVLIGIGIESFLFMFFTLSYVGSYLTAIDALPDSRLEMYGLFGMTFFIAMISYLIVKFKTFDIKLLATQALVWALIILIGSEFFFIQNNTNRILTAITLLITGWLGLMIIRSVKKEIVLREKLQVANAGQTNLIHIMNHQIKGYLTINKNIFAELLTDDYGKVPDEAREIIEKGLESSDKGQKYVAHILRGDSAENGTLTYDMEPFDFKKIVSEVSAKQKEHAEEKGLMFYTEILEGDYNMVGDETQLKEVVRNLIENSIFYTQNGNISVRLKRKPKMIRFSVKDTGVGVKEIDKTKMFTVGGVAGDSIKINTNSSGYGLAFVKGVVEKHGGKAWFESTGQNQGSTFIIDLPVK